jgi:hypothetical protein
MLIATLGAMLAVTLPAFADHTRPPAAGAATESSIDIDVKLGARSFRLGGRVVGPGGYAGGAWLDGRMRSDGFSLDGRLEHDGQTRDFRLDVDVDEWARRAIRWRGVTDL